MTPAPATRDERRARAAARLVAAPPGRWYFPLLGLVPVDERLPLDDATALVRVTDAPTEPELAAALSEPRLFATLGPVAPHVAAELVIERRPGAGAAVAAALATHVVTGLRVRTGADGVVLAQASHSWSTLCGLADGRCAIRVLDAVAAPALAVPAAVVSAADVAWVAAHLKPLADLLEAPRFRLAADALGGQGAEKNARLEAAKLWCGVEALLQPGDNRLRLAAAVATLLVPASAERPETYRRIERLLAERAGILTGAAITTVALDAHITSARTLLARLLVFFVERGALPEGTRLDDLLFWCSRPSLDAPRAAGVSGRMSAGPRGATGADA